MAITSERGANWPWELSRAAWLRIVDRSVREVANDRILLVAAGVAFYALFAIFPGIIALTAIYGLLADPQSLENEMSTYFSQLPPSAATVVQNQLRELVTYSPEGLGLGVLLGFVTAVWGTSAGTTAMIRAVNIAYDRRETRHLVKLRWLGITLAATSVLLAALAIFLVAALPALLRWLGAPEIAVALITSLRWPFLAAVAVVNFAAVYRHAPDRPPPAWRWVLPGAVLAVSLWLLGTLALSFYVEHFGQLSRIQGTVGGVIALLVWLYASTFSVLVGAELGAELEVEASPGNEQPSP